MIQQKNLSIIGSAIKKFASKILPTAPVEAIAELVNQFFKHVLSIKNDGWVKDFLGNWYYYENGKEKTGWIQDNGKWYYTNNKGKMQTGWVEDNGEWYYLNDKEGDLAVGWVKYDDPNEGEKWYYFDENGSTKTGFVPDNKGNWYYIQSDHTLLKNETLHLNGNEYYFDENGVMAANKWLPGENGKWWYYNSDGESEIGWVNVDGNYYYLDSDHNLATGWLNMGDEWYHMDESGALQKGWQNIDDEDYYFYTDSGAMATGWIQQGDYEYYLNPKGHLTRTIGDKCYNLYTNGSYYRDAAVAYATNPDYTSEDWQNEDSFLNWKKHTRKHNPQYQRCDDYSYYLQGHLHGSDCANFVSQVLYAGGVESNEYWNACLVPDAKGEVIQGSNYVATASWINV